MAVAAVHFCFVAFMVFGSFLTWRWPRVIWLHVLAVVWGIGSTALSLDCPLTDVERWARPRAGLAQLPPDGFIAHYITGVLYPAAATNIVRVSAIVLVLIAWGGWVRRRRGGRAH